MHLFSQHLSQTRRHLVVGACLTVASFGLMAQTAEKFPSKPVKLVVPFPAGGGTDTMARALADSLARAWGQPVIVDNKAGAGTVVGNDFVAKSPPNGLTLLLNTSAVAIVPGLNPKLPYSADSGLTAITVLGHAPNVAVVRAESPIKSAVDFLAQAKAKPGKLTYGSAGNGTSTHLSAELLKSSARIFVTHVPYRGAMPAITDLMGGQIDLVFGTLPSVAPFLDNGKLRAIAVTSSARTALLPDTPTFSESGVPGYSAPVWYGVFVAGGTPEPMVQMLYQSIQRASESDEFKKRTRAEGLTLTLETPAAADALYRKDMAKWKTVIQAQSIRAD